MDMLKHNILWEFESDDNIHSEFKATLIGMVYDEGTGDNSVRMSLICMNGDFTMLGMSLPIAS